MEIKNKIKLIIPIALGTIAISIFLYAYFRHLLVPSKNNLFVSGTVEATEVRVSFQVSGRIKELLTDEGAMVKNGNTVAKIDTDELIQKKTQAEKALAEATVIYQRLNKDYDRYENLYKIGSISQQKRDDAKANAETAKAKVDALRASLELANINLRYADLKTPLDGFVLVKSAEAGEYVQIGSTVFTIADLKNIWVTGYINETDLGKVKLNQVADVKTDTYPNKIYKGRVSFISEESEFTPKQIETKEERVKRVYRIKITIDNKEQELKPGMPVEAYINI